MDSVSDVSRKTGQLVDSVSDVSRKAGQLVDSKLLYRLVTLARTLSQTLIVCKTDACCTNTERKQTSTHRYSKPRSASS